MAGIDNADIDANDSDDGDESEDGDNEENFAPDDAPANKKSRISLDQKRKALEYRDNVVGKPRTFEAVKKRFAFVKHPGDLARYKADVVKGMNPTSAYYFRLSPSISLSLELSLIFSLYHVFIGTCLVIQAAILVTNRKQSMNT